MVLDNAKQAQTHVARDETKHCLRCNSLIRYPCLHRFLGPLNWLLVIIMQLLASRYYQCKVASAGNMSR